MLWAETYIEEDKEQGKQGEEDEDTLEAKTSALRIRPRTHVHCSVGLAGRVALR